jgi:hypothetical protein
VVSDVTVNTAIDETVTVNTEFGKECDRIFGMDLFWCIPYRRALYDLTSFSSH